MNNDWAWVLALSAAIGSLFYTARNALLSLWKYIESIAILRLDTARPNIPAWVVVRWLRQNGRMVYRRDYRLSHTSVPCLPSYLQRRPWANRTSGCGQYVSAYYQDAPLPSIWLVQGWKPVWITSAEQVISGQGSDSGPTDVWRPVRITTLRGLLSPDAFFLGLLQRMGEDLNSEQQSNRFEVITKVGNYLPQLRQLDHNSTTTHNSGSNEERLSNNSLPPVAGTSAYISVYNGYFPFEALDADALTINRDEIVRGLVKGARLRDLWVSPELTALAKELKYWKENQAWFLERGLPYKRSYGLTGPPGNGKTAFIRAIGAELGMPVLLYDLTSFNNRELVREWDAMRHMAPCIAVLEDLDRIFKDGQPREGISLSYDCLLNLLDGLKQATGICVFITSNHPEDLDEALMKKRPDGTYICRPGRVDRVVECLSPPSEGRRKIAGGILLGLEDQLERIVMEGEGDSGAEFQYRCCREAEEFFWREAETKKITKPL